MQQMGSKTSLNTFLLAIVLLTMPCLIWAGNIDPGYAEEQYVYGENIGWINFEPSQGPGVTVIGTGVTGYAWGENIGWINFSPTTGGGVTINPITGVLGGYAWGENIGWINFASSGGGVFIDASGDFNGKAWSENIGWISFRSDSAYPFYLRTSWKLTEDTTPPAITIAIPPDGATYYLNTIVTPVYTVSDSGSGVEFSMATSMDTLTLGTHKFTVSAKDKAGNSSSLTHNYSVVADNTPPMIHIVSPANGATYYVNDTVLATYSVADSETGVASITANAAVGAPLNASKAGFYAFTVSATDKAGNTRSVTNTFTIVFSGNIDPGNSGSQYAWGENVGWINLKPSWGPGTTVTNSAVTGYMWGENIGWIKLNPANGGVFNDGAGNLSGYAWGENAGWIKFAHTYGGVRINPATGVFSGYAWGENIGWINFGPAGRAVVTSWHVPNQPPVASDQSVSTNRDISVGIDLTATDPESNPLTFYVVSGPSHGTLSGSAPTLTYSPNTKYYGPDSFTFKANDGLADSNVATVNILVNPVNYPPILIPIGNKTANEGQPLEFTITAVDPDGDALTYSASNLPTGAIFDPDNGKFSWTPGYDQAGNYSNVLFTVTDNGTPNELAFEYITITVGNINRAPVFTPAGTKSIFENQLLQFNVVAADPDGDTITYSTGPLPRGASFNPTNRLFSWRPDNTQAGSYAISFYAKDAGSPSEQGRLDVVINVGETPSPCEISNRIIQAVLELNLAKSVENSYMANLKKVCRFLEEGKIIPAINQLDAFINKVRIDLSKGNINQAAGNNLISVAINLINTIKG